MVGKRKTAGATTGVWRNCFGEKLRRNAIVLEVTSQDVHDYLTDNVTFINQSVLYVTHIL